MSQSHTQQSIGQALFNRLFDIKAEQTKAIDKQDWEELQKLQTQHNALMHKLTSLK